MKTMIQCIFIPVLDIRWSKKDEMKIVLSEFRLGSPGEWNEFMKHAPALDRSSFDRQALGRAPTAMKTSIRVRRQLSVNTGTLSMCVITSIKI